MDVFLGSSWRAEGLGRFSRGGVAVLADSERSSATDYIWRQGRFEVVVERQDDGWKVVSTTAGRLFGPRQVLYEASHKLAKHAAWDVMACVIRASQNEDEGVNAGREAARWMRERQAPDA